MEKMNVEEHLDEVLGIVEKPPKEIKKVDVILDIEKKESFLKKVIKVYD